MSNYLSQIAARNTGPEQPLLTPAHSPVEKGLNDPFESAAIAHNETGRVREGTPAATITPAANSEVILQAKPVSDPLEKADTPEQPETIKPVYLSKYIERNNYYTHQHTNTVVTKEPGKKETVAEAIKSPAATIFTSVQNNPAVSETVSKQTGSENAVSVQHQKSLVATELVPRQQNKDLEKLPQETEQPLKLQPVAKATPYDTKPVLLQPQLPMQPGITAPKEKPAPALVIGKITVEIVPAQKPVNKIINHVVKPQPQATPSTQRNKNSFGLGQL